jgi:hypothetical protein
MKVGQRRGGPKKNAGRPEKMDAAPLFAPYASVKIS